MPCYDPARNARCARKRKAVRGCIVGPDIASLSLTIVKVESIFYSVFLCDSQRIFALKCCNQQRGEQDLPGLTDTKIPRRLGPKRVGKIVKMFNLSRNDDVRDYVVRRKVTTKNGNKITKKPKIQRLITPVVIQRRKQIKRKLKNRRTASYQKRKEYFERLTARAERLREKKEQVEDAVEKSDKKPKGKGKGKGKRGN